MPQINPGPWHDLDGIYFEVGKQTFGPFRTEEEAEREFSRTQQRIQQEKAAARRAARIRRRLSAFYST